MVSRRTAFLVSVALLVVLSTSLVEGGHKNNNKNNNNNKNKAEARALEDAEPKPQAKAKPVEVKPKPAKVKDVPKPAARPQPDRAPAWKTDREPIADRNIKGLKDKWQRWFDSRQGEQDYVHVFKGREMTRAAWKNPYEKISGVEKFWNVPFAKKRIEAALANDDIEITQKNYIKENIFFNMLEGAAREDTRWENCYGGMWMFLVGGYVRDLLIPDPVASKDVDIGVMENPEEFERLCKRLHWTCHTERHSFFNIFKFGLPLPGYGDHVTAIEALPSLITVGATNAWRDFTVNAVYYDMQTTVFLDPTGQGKDDCETKTLRIANFKEGEEDKRTWYRFFDETWYETGAGPQKIARYFHMRLKGFKAEKHTRDYVLRKMWSGMSDEDAALVVRQWSRQTLNNDDTRAKKAAKMFRIMVEDLNLSYKNNQADVKIKWIKKWYKLCRAGIPQSYDSLPTWAQNPSPSMF